MSVTNGYLMTGFQFGHSLKGQRETIHKNKKKTTHKCYDKKHSKSPKQHRNTKTTSYFVSNEISQDIIQQNQLLCI